MTPFSAIHQFASRALRCGLLVALSVGPAKAETAVSFSTQVRPILSENCFLCHGPDESSREAGFRLDVRQDAVDAGAIVPGKPDESLIIERAFATDPDVVMPPPRSHKSLSNDEKELLRRWIAEGAEYAAHWAYDELRRPTPPEPVWPRRARNPIDAFLQRRLEGVGAEPSRVADRGALLRRVSLDLTGLPPTIDEQTTFEADRSAGAYSRQVDRLLRSPHHGERLAQMWLDLARYADTVGFHGDQNQNVWAYRDYVIESFNANKPFDEFTREQLAGDLLPEPTVDQRIATCFNRLNMMTREGGAQPAEYLAIYTADRIRTVGQAWLGSTFGCAECHDHKFDPIAQRDFYALGAFFADVKQWGVYQDLHYTPNSDLAGFGNDHPFPPEISVPSPALQREREEAQRRRAAVADGLDPASAAFESWFADTREFVAQHPTGWASPEPRVSFFQREERWYSSPKERVAGPEYHELDPSRAIVIKPQAPQEIEVVLRPPGNRLSSVKLELLPDRGLGGWVAELGWRFTLRLKLERLRDGKRTAIPVRHADADHAAERYRSSHAVIGVQDGWQLRKDAVRRPQAAIYLLKNPIKLQEGDELAVSLWPDGQFHGPWSGKAPKKRLGRIRLSVSPLASPDIETLDLPDDLGKRLADSASTKAWFVSSGADDPQIRKQVRELDAAVLATRRGRTPVQVTEAVDDPMVTRILPRGDWQDKSGAVVEPATPRFLPGPAIDGRRLTRLDLAEWLCSDENPLTARVFVNRLWRMFFGMGLSASVDDFGAQGEPPSHPELLDWLACELRDSGWDVRHVVRLIVESHAYRQSSRPRVELAELDPGNRLLAWQNARRLDAEFVRDNALAISGLVNLEFGGPPAKPHQPAGYYAALQFPNRRYQSDAGPRQHRRGVYMHWQRTFLHPMLANFDAPSREDCTALRTVSNSPQQALTLLNDPSFVEAAKAWADRLIRHSEDDAERIDRAYRQALARAPRPEEVAGILKLVEALREQYRKSPGEADELLKVGAATEADDPIELAAWTNVARVILNLHETITRY